MFNHFVASGIKRLNFTFYVFIYFVVVCLFKFCFFINDVFVGKNILNILLYHQKRSLYIIDGQLHRTQFFSNGFVHGISKTTIMNDIYISFKLNDNGVRSFKSPKIEIHQFILQ